MPEPTHAVYVISVAAELAGVHPQTLRIYERKGLLEPARTGGGSRRYSSADIDLLRRIQELTNDGLNLVGVQRILDLEAQLAARSAEVDALRAELEAVRAQSVRAVREAQREHRRDLVPLNQELLLYRRPRAR